jgi:hypothetical protein
MDGYIRWLKQRYPVYEMAGTYWRQYQSALVPACPKPEPLMIEPQQAQELLRRSGALFLRYFTRTIKHPTSFWYTACQEYNFTSLAQKARSHIRRGYKSCRIERVDPVWLANNGYPCYVAAFSRYKNSHPESREKFDEMCRVESDAPFEFWGVFAGERLVAFAKCVVGSDYVATLVLKQDPDYMQLSTGPALQDAILRNYVTEQKKPVYAGFRSVVHDTRTHDFLLQLGYSRVYCDLKVIYKPLVEACVNLLYGWRSLVDRAPESPVMNNIKGVLTQEEIRRSIELDGRRVTHHSIVERIARSVWGSRC